MPHAAPPTCQTREGRRPGSQLVDSSGYLGPNQRPRLCLNERVGAPIPREIRDPADLIQLARDPAPDMQKY
jgi:hypothetical protein